MQSYYKTLFYSNVYDTTTYVVLADQTEKIIEEEDIERGYVIKEQLLELYDYCIKANDIGTYSYLIEYCNNARWSRKSRDVSHKDYVKNCQIR